MKYAVVTGGTKGIGKQICIDLMQAGYFIFTNYAHDEQSAKNARKDFAFYSSNYKVLKIDQSDIKSINSFVNFIKNKTKEINCIICNTGITLKKSVDTILNAEWESVFMVNIHSHFYLIRDLSPIIQKRSKIVFIGSLLGEVPHSTSLAYGVTKAAIHALANNLVKEFSDKKTTVNIVAPGFVETDWQKSKPLWLRDKINEKISLKRFATVKEISNACMMLLDNDYINGATIAVDGGYNYQ